MSRSRNPEFFRMSEQGGLNRGSSSFDAKRRQMVLKLIDSNIYRLANDLSNDLPQRILREFGILRRHVRTCNILLRLFGQMLELSLCGRVIFLSNVEQ